MPNPNETWGKYSPHEVIIFLKFDKHWAKIVDFLLGHSDFRMAFLMTLRLFFYDTGPSMPQPLAYHSLTQLANGDVAIVGGYNHAGHGTILSQTYKFYCIEGNCQYMQGSDLAIPRYGHVALPVEVHCN